MAAGKTTAVRGSQRVGEHRLSINLLRHQVDALQEETAHLPLGQGLRTPSRVVQDLIETHLIPKQKRRASK